jgi:hypothetical protein
VDGVRGFDIPLDEERVAGRFGGTWGSGNGESFEEVEAAEGMAFGAVNAELKARMSMRVR